MPDAPETTVAKVLDSRNSSSPAAAHLPADAGLLVAAERAVGAEVVAAVDGERSGPDAPGHRQRPVLAAEHGTGEPVDRVVGDAHRVVVVLVGDDGQHRPEHLLLGDLAVGVDVGEQRGGIEVARVDLLAAGDQRGAGLDGTLDHAVDLVALLLTDQRTHVGLGIGRVAVPHQAEVVLDQLDDLVVVLARHQQPRRQRAALAGVGHHA